MAKGKTITYSTSKNYGSAAGSHSPAAGVSVILMFYVWLVATMLMWWLALASTGDYSPEWLKRAQAACFGRTASGLPDNYGWWVLILSPLSFLAALLVTFGSELKASFANLLKHTSGKVLLLVTLFAVLIQSVWAGSKIKSGLAIENASYGSVYDLPLPESYPTTNKKAPAFTLINQYGKKFSLQDLKGKPTILTFAFAHCQTVCPALMATAKKAVKELPPDSVQLAVITLDPWRDTPASLPSIAEGWGLKGKSYVLSGDVENVNKVIKAYDVPALRSEKTGDVSHPALMFVLDSNLNIRYTFQNPPSHWLVEAVKRIRG